MNKGLEALECLMNGCCNRCTDSICGEKNNGACRYFQKYKIIETTLKTNKKKLDAIGEILVNISKGNYSDLYIATDEIREVLEDE